MPKRVIDFDALWASDKIASCPAWAQAEYAWLYGLADASGSFELTNLRVIWGRVAAVRKDLTLERLEDIFQEFIARGLLFTWEAGGKRYGHWTGSDVPGRLPAPSWRARLERLAPPVPKREFAEYMSQFSSRREPIFGDKSALPDQISEKRYPGTENRGDGVTASATGVRACAEDVDSAQLKLGLDVPQGQDWDKDWNEKERKEHTAACVPAARTSERVDNEEHCRFVRIGPKTSSAEELLEIYERDRGSLPAAAGLTPERRRQCGLRIRGGLSGEQFGAAVRRAAATPFLTGEGARGWRASFDWLIANDTNVRKVIEGVYDSVEARATAKGGFGLRAIDRTLYSEIHVGTGPIAAQSGARVKPEAIERMRAREAARRPP